ncbi:hypothetical protein B0H13DRAFT_1853205 [Mycena leptocephala]|nr:hypothetical protein B0H13DRAFT_1853205 [Mycena leptocephala]
MSCLLEGRKKLRRGDEEEWMRWIPESRCLACWPEERGWRRQGEWRAQEEALCGMIDYHGTRVFRNAQFTFAEFLAKIVREFGSSQQLQDTSPDIFLLLLLIAPRGRYICGFSIEGLVRAMVISGIVHEHVKAREDRRHSAFELQQQGKMIPTHPGSRYMGAGEISKVKPPAGRGIGGLVDGDVQASFVRRIAFFEQNSTFGRGFHGGVTLVGSLVEEEAVRSLKGRPMDSKSSAEETPVGVILGGEFIAMRSSARIRSFDVSGLVEGRVGALKCSMGREMWGEVTVAGAVLGEEAAIRSSTKIRRFVGLISESEETSPMGDHLVAVWGCTSRPLAWSTLAVCICYTPHKRHRPIGNRYIDVAPNLPIFPQLRMGPVILAGLFMWSKPD